LSLDIHIVHFCIRLVLIFPECNVICIAHNRGTSNALYALVRCKQKRLQLFSKTVSADGGVSQILW